MCLIRYLSLFFVFILFGCAASIRGNDSSSSHVVIKDHVLSGSGYSDVINQARNYCRQFNANAILKSKKEGCLFFCGTEYNYYQFDCVKERQFAPSYQVPSAPSKPPVSVDEAKDKCTNLGFKTGTESYGKCVLQLLR
jgi:hypothetical protein